MSQKRRFFISSSKSFVLYPNLEVYIKGHYRLPTQRMPGWWFQPHWIIRTLSKVLSLCKGCKDKAAKAETKIQPVTLPAPSFTHLILFTTGTTRSQWTDSERTLNVHWTCSERGIEHWENWGKERIRGNRKKLKYLCFVLKITVNCTDLLLFAAFWIVFNVCSMLRSLYVHCMFNVSFSGRRPKT